MYPAIRCANSTSLPMWARSSEWNDPVDGGMPYCMGNWVKMPLPAMPSPPLKRRSEARYSNSGLKDDAFYACGQTTGFEGWVQPRLGACSIDPALLPDGSFEQSEQKRHWHCLAQLHGASYDGSFGGASVTLQVRQGKWFIEHGTRSWSHEIMPYVDGKAVYVKLYVTLTEEENKGRIWGSIAGVPFEFFHKTWWHQWLIWQHGIYRGSGMTEFVDGGSQPTYYQENNWNVTKMTSGAPLDRSVAWPIPTT